MTEDTAGGVRSGSGSVKLWNVWNWYILWLLTGINTEKAARRGLGGGGGEFEDQPGES